MIRLFDSFSRRKVEFLPLTPGEVRMYLCGPTVYDSPHVGHARAAVAFDVARRHFQWSGFHVKFVRNITDIDDKIIKRANEAGVPFAGLAQRYIDEYESAVTALGVLRPDVVPRVTEHIADILSLIQRLMSDGHAYDVEGDVYYRVARFPAYGKLSGQPLDELLAGARVEIDERKESPLDFALWKAAKPGEPSWASPWGAGRPGWHIECSAMCARHLGETFDIHAGGKDLIFPHHENEIAQSQGAFGQRTFARYWMHNGFVNLNDVKMSKSLGNVFNVSQALASNDAEALRLYLIQTHYRSPINFEVVGQTTPSFPGIDESERRLDYLYGTLARLDHAAGASAGKPLEQAEKLRDEVRAALDDDFNTAVAVAAIGEAAKTANRLLDEPKSVPRDIRMATLARLRADLRETAAVLGLLTRSPGEFLDVRRARLANKKGIDVAAIHARVNERELARRAKAYARADMIRDELRGLGIEVMDTSAGPTWRILD